LQGRGTDVGDANSTEWTDHFEVAVEVADGSSAQGAELRNWTDSSAVSTIRSTKGHRCAGVGST
jgi:hypothetical protein